MTIKNSFLAREIRLRASTGLLVVVLWALISGCSSPVEPLDEQPLVEAEAPVTTIDKTMPLLEVAYFMWSEKGIPSEVDISMWSPQEGFQKERITLTDVPMERTFYIHPDRYRDVDFTLYNRTEATLVRAIIRIEGLVVASGYAEGAIPLVALDARGYKPTAQALLTHREN